MSSSPTTFLRPAGQTTVMGVLNVTPDSFSDGGQFLEPAAAVARAAEMLRQGAHIIDVGGESTRPGASPVSESEEIRRVVPVVRALCGELGAAVSVDTSKPGVMRAAVQAGACLVNDVRALSEPGALQAAADSGAMICLMHMRGQPRTMQDSPVYRDVVSEVRNFLLERVQHCLDAGIESEKLILDPGFGFGKTLQHNIALLDRLDALTGLAWPVLVGLSRKSMLGALTGQAPGQRLAGSIAAAVIAALHGARIVRVHDVQATVDALKVVDALRGASKENPGS